MQSPFNEDYYLRGKEVGVSNYTDYRWLEEPTMALAKRVIEVMNIKPGETFLDYGASRGYLVKAMRRLGVIAWGCDISEWAVRNCDPEVTRYLSFGPMQDDFDHIWCKDTAEHMDSQELARTVTWMEKAAKKSILFIVPLARGQGNFPLWYVRDEDNQDKTHIIRWTLEQWMEFVWAEGISGKEWQLQGSWHIPGLKPASLPHPKSCGFISLTRVKGESS